MPISVTDADSFLDAELRATAYTGPATLYAALFSGGVILDAGLTSGSAVLTSAADAQFTAADVGLTVTGTGIPASTTIASVQSATSATMSASATATGSGVVVTIGGGIGATEFTGGSGPYARQTVAFTAASGGSSDNSAVVTFAGLPAGTFRSLALMDALTAGNDRWSGPANPAQIVLAGASLQFAVDSIVATASSPANT